MKSPWSIERYWNSCTLIKVLTKKDWNKKKFWLSLGLVTFELLILNWTDCPNLFLRLVQVITHLIPQRLQVLSHYLSFYLKFSMKIVISSIVRRPCSFSSRFKTCNFRPVFFKMIKKKKKKRFNRSRSAIFGEFFAKSWGDLIIGRLMTRIICIRPWCNTSCWNLTPGMTREIYCWTQMPR